MNNSQQQCLNENNNGFVDIIRVFWTISTKSFVPITCMVIYFILLIITLNAFKIEINDDNIVIDWAITWRNIFWHVECIILMFLISYYATKYQARNAFTLSSSRQSITPIITTIIEEEEEISAGNNNNTNNNNSNKTTTPITYFDDTLNDRQQQNTSSIDHSRIGITYNEDEDSAKTEYTMATVDFDDIVTMPPFNDDGSF